MSQTFLYLMRIGFPTVGSSALNQRIITWRPRVQLVNISEFQWKIPKGGWRCSVWQLRSKGAH